VHPTDANHQPGVKVDLSHGFSHSLSKQGLQQSNEPYSPPDPSIDMMVVVVLQISHSAVPISTPVLLP
jgi:hypothetical protein